MISCMIDVALEL